MKHEVAMRGQPDQGQKPPRLLGAFDTFAVQFAVIGIAGSVFLTFCLTLPTYGPIFFWAWTIGSVLQLTVGLSIAEVASAYAVAGSCYSWVRILYSQRLAAFVGYLLILSYLSAFAFTAYAAVPYLLQLAGVANPTTSQIRIVTTIVLLAQTAINLLPVHSGTRVNNLRVTIELAAMGVLLVVLLTVGLHSSTSILFKAHWGLHEHIPPVLLLLVGAGTAGIGNFDAAANLAEEIDRPLSTVPTSSMLANVIAVLSSTALLGVGLLAISDLNKTTSATLPLAYVMQTRVGIAFANIMEALMIVTFCFSGIVLQMSASRLIWAQARDGVLPRQLYRLSNARVPAVAVVCIAVIAAGFTLWHTGLEALGAIGGLAAVLAYGITVAVSLYSKARGRLPRDRAWNLGRWGMINDVVALGWSLLVLAILPFQNLTLAEEGFLGAVILGLLLYLSMGQIQARRSRA